ncbi:MAG: hypothetical protein AABY18_06545 [Candidatus Thermoplasmatota archaeon]
MSARARWAASRAWVRDHPYRTAAALYVVLAAVFVHDWDGYVFATSVEGLWHGHTPYSVAQDDPWYGYLNVADEHVQWYAYPPLPLLAMAVTYLPSVLLPLPAFADRVLLKLPMLAGTLALAWVAGNWARRLDADAATAKAIERRFLFNPFLILVGAVWGMTDTSLMALYMGGLLAVANGRRGVGGVLLGLSILVKPFPLLLLLPLLPYLIHRDGWGPTARLGAWISGTVAAVCLPFFVAEPQGFWRQAVGAHLARNPQGLTLWSLWPLDQLPNDVVSILSLGIMAAGLLLVGYAATRLRGKGTSLVLTLAAAIAILVANRVVNEQYLVLVVAPMLVLDVAHRLDRFGHLLTRWTPELFAAAIVLVGFHFLTFIPPDIANRLFSHPTDFVAHQLRQLTPGLWVVVTRFFEVAVPVTIVALGALAWRLVRQRVADSPLPPPSSRSTLAPTAGACLVLAVLGLVPLLGGATARDDAFVPAYDEPRVAAFYYLWWQNPAHDPDVLYGNWPVVSQHPTMGYYTNTRGVAREHASMMVENGIDSAIVSYHRGELQRYQVFQEEASEAGLWVTPLIELNQVYDQPEHHPVDQNGVKVPYAAYRLTNDARAAIETFVLDLKDQLAQPSTLRIDGRPVVMFYDSYVSGVSFHEEDRHNLAATLLGLSPIEELRSAFGDPTMPATVEGVLRHHPTIMTGFYDPGSAALWRRAHLEAHKQFWTQLRAEVEAELGPLYLVSGDALNERAGFDAGTVKALVGLEVFDASFIYSPSFTWGNQPNAPFNDTFALYEDRNHWLTSFARTAGAGSSFGIAPAYDDTVNRPRGFVIPAFPFGDEGDTFYDLSWDSTAAQPPTLAAVATFNEWFEGSSVEPSRQYGDRFLTQTIAERDRLTRMADTPAALDVVVLVNERSSRTSLQYSETDLSHFWGLDLLAAVPRAIPGAEVGAMDALEPQLADAPTPDLILVEGGRGEFAVSAAVSSRLSAWSGTVPHLVFGPDVARPLGPALGEDCLRGLDDVPDPKTLVAGDVLRGGSGTVSLERGGVTYDVGNACRAGNVAGMSVKPWVATNATLQVWGGAYDRLNAECLGVALRALLPAFAAPDAADRCVVPQPPAGLNKT